MSSVAAVVDADVGVGAAAVVVVAIVTFSGFVVAQDCAVVADRYNDRLDYERSKAVAEAPVAESSSEDPVAK